MFSPRTGSLRPRRVTDSTTGRGSHHPRPGSGTMAATRGTHRPVARCRSRGGRTWLWAGRSSTAARPRRREPPWPPTSGCPGAAPSGLGAQHVVAMFGATFVFPLIMGLNPQLAIMMSGIATIAFLLIVQGKVPSYLGTSASFVGGVAAIRHAGRRLRGRDRRDPGRRRRARARRRAHPLPRHRRAAPAAAARWSPAPWSC